MNWRIGIVLPALVGLWAGQAQARFDWLPWRRKAEAEPVDEPFTVLGMEPLTALLLMVAIIGLGLALYHRPRAFMNGFAEMMGAMTGMIVAAIAGGIVLVGTAAFYFETSAVAVLLLFAIIGVIVVFGFLSGGGA